jgi:ABC-type bacteriocin/lantibiotic exporter with double-glycine peptidase domain
MKTSFTSFIILLLLFLIIFIIYFSPTKFDKISFRNITFSYDKSKELLNNISFDVDRKEKILITGNYYSGKTTLMKLLLKYYIPDSGEILVSGKNIKDINTDILRKRIHYIPGKVTRKDLLKNYDTIILDEPTDDFNNKQEIISLIKEYTKDKTVIIISHDDIYSNFVSKKIII